MGQEDRNSLRDLGAVGEGAEQPQAGSTTRGCRLSWDAQQGWEECCQPHRE